MQQSFVQGYTVPCIPPDYYQPPYAMSSPQVMAPWTPMIYAVPQPVFPLQCIVSVPMQPPPPASPVPQPTALRNAPPLLDALPLLGAPRYGVGGVPFQKDPFHGTGDSLDSSSPPMYKFGDRWRESHVASVVKPFRGQSAEFVVRGCLPLLLSFHARNRTRQWEHLVIHACGLSDTSVIQQLTETIHALSAHIPLSKTRPYLALPIFAYGAGSMKDLPNGSPNPIATLRHDVAFQFRGMQYVDGTGAIRRWGTQYSDVVCRDHVPGVSVCQRVICRFAHPPHDGVAWPAVEQSSSKE